MTRGRHSGECRNPVTDQIDLWTSALLVKSTAGRGNNGRLEAYGIRRLRELIFKLAIAGKLHGGDPTGWPEVLLGDIGKWGSGGTPPKTNPEYYGGDIPWLVIGDLNDGLVNNAETRITNLGLENSSTQIVPEGALLIAMYGSIGKLGIAGISCATNQAIAFCIPDERKLTTEYLFVYLRAIRGDLLSKGQGLAQQNISQKILKATPICLPPKEDQKRIISKVSELMALCEQLEQQQGRGIEAHQTLVETLLGTLTNVESAQEFATAWNRIAEHFDTLFTTEHSIDQLKQTILQLAVMGKLVPQVLEEEPANKLLDKIATIAANKSVPINKSSIRKISRDDELFELPVGWLWVRSEVVASFVDPHPSHRTPPEVNDGIPYIGYSDINRELGIDFGNARKIDPKVFEDHQSRYQLKEGDFVFGKIGTLGEPFFLPQPFRYCLSANLILVQPNSSLIHPKYLAMFLDSPVFIDVMGEQKTNSTHGVFGIKKARHICLPLPPLLEQHRIVAKVDELMTLCDALKARLAEARTTQVRLADAIVERAIAAPEPASV